MTNYQVMRDLTSAEYEELKADIKERGVKVAIELDEDGNVLDGHHRLKICQELGITDYPKEIRKGLTDDEKRTHARMLNVARRQLTPEEKRALIREQLKETPEKSNRQIAKGLGVNDKTVGKQRMNLESSAEIPQLNYQIGTDGKERPRQRKPSIKPRKETDDPVVAGDKPNDEDNPDTVNNLDDKRFKSKSINKQIKEIIDSIKNPERTKHKVITPDSNARNLINHIKIFTESIDSYNRNGMFPVAGLSVELKTNITETFEESAKKLKYLLEDS